jgi:hypothetical protein
MNIIQKLKVCGLGGEIYHSDGHGHIQVEQVSSYGFETPAFLLEQVEKEGLWPEFFEMAKAKEDEWILRITRYFSDTDHYSTTCFVEFLSILSSRDAQIQLIQDSPLWFWEEKNAPMMNRVIDKATQLINSPSCDPLDKEIDLSILNGVISRLETKRNKTEQA